MRTSISAIVLSVKVVETSAGNAYNSCKSAAKCCSQLRKPPRTVSMSWNVKRMLGVVLRSVTKRILSIDWLNCGKVWKPSAVVRLGPDTSVLTGVSTANSVMSLVVAVVAERSCSVREVLVLSCISTKVAVSKVAVVVEGGRVGVFDWCEEINICITKIVMTTRMMPNDRAIVIVLVS